MASLNEYGATVTLVRSGIDTVQTVVIKPDGSFTGSFRVVPRPAGPEHELTDDEKTALSQDLQTQIDANPDDFEVPVLEAVVEQIGSYGAGQPAPAAFDLSIITKESGKVVATRTLTCNPAGGSHPTPVAACEQLSKVAGRIEDIPEKQGICTEIFLPVILRASGTWDGEKRHYEHGFPNRCVGVLATGGVVFDFEGIEGGTRFCSDELLSQFKATKALAPTVETGDIHTGGGTRVTFERGRFFCSTRASQGGFTSAPQELNAGEMEALLSSLRDESGNPPPDLNVDALGTFIDLLSQAVGDGAMG